ncbi:MAG: DUF2169 domain-containing protein [Polyangiaceae bacterium]|nr:DUF2169 domain-containing protein [Polyangiaceae bacterium]
MKVIKPLRLGILTRVFEHGREPFLVATVFACFPFDEPKALFTEQALWKMMTEELGPGAALDVGLPKPRGELLVDGHAYAPDGAPQPAVSVEVAIASVKKTLWVCGNRRWELLGMSMPEPFVTMPVDWAHAFGGEGFAQNPLGKGFVAVTGADGKKHTPLPNVEYPDKRIQSKGDRPPPASFRTIDYTWPQRMKKLGTYDKTWLERESPGFARDIDLEAFNAAPDDQRITGFFQGDETFTVVNMHPTEKRLEGRLPGLAARVFATVRKTTNEEEGDELREISMRADTVHLFPHRKAGIVTFRGLLRIAEDDAADVRNILIAAERVGEPRSREHYEQVLAARLDRERGGLLALRDKDLLPDLARYAGDDPYLDEMMGKLEREGLLEQNLYRKALKNHEERVQKAIALGFDPADLVGPAPTPPTKPTVDPSEVAEVVEAAKKDDILQEEELERARKSSEEQARALCEKNGLDYDEVVKKAEEEGGGPPQFSADREIERVRAAVAEARAAGLPMPALEAMANDPRFERRLRDNERALFEMYRRFVHQLPGVKVSDEALAKARGEVFLAALAEPEATVAERDFSGADLRGADLSNKDLRFAFLEKANLEGANLEGANLEGAVLGRANLKGANLSRTRLVSANLGHCDLTEATLDGADLTHATLDSAKLDKTRLLGVRLEGTTFESAVVRGASLAGASMDKCIFRDVTFDETSFAGADSSSTVFIECSLFQTSFENATMKTTAFFGCKADGLVFRGAKADNVRFVHECSMQNAVFAGASLKSANLRDAHMPGADLEAADLEGADLSGANLEGARIDRANMRESRLVRTNLTGAQLTSVNLLGSIMQKARVQGANFRGSNLFRADLAYVVGDDQTTFSGAYIDQVRVIRRQT